MLSARRETTPSQPAGNCELACYTGCSLCPHLTMYIRYLYWQHVAAPVWILKFGWNLQQALLVYFSVPVMVRTLFSFWHRDRASLRQGTLSGIIEVIVWNSISRVIGFFFRLTVIVAWLATATFFILGSSIIFSLFLLWPWLIVAGFIVGSTLLIN